MRASVVLSPELSTQMVARVRQLSEQTGWPEADTWAWIEQDMATTLATKLPEALVRSFVKP